MSDILVSHRILDDPIAVSYRTHAHEKWEFLLIPKGSVKCMVEGRQYQIKDAALVILKPGQIHRICPLGQKEYEYYSLMCDLPKVYPKLTALPLGRVTILLLHDQNRIYTVFKELAMECSSDGLLEELFEIIADSVAAGDILTTFTINPSVEKAIAFIEMNILDPITLDMICDSVGVKKCTLYNLFLSNLMLAPTRYIRAKRMALAKMMLIDDLTTQKYLNYCGFENTEVFEDAYENFYRSIP